MLQNPFAVRLRRSVAVSAIYDPRIQSRFLRFSHLTCGQRDCGVFVKGHDTAGTHVGCSRDGIECSK